MAGVNPFAPTQNQPSQTPMPQGGGVNPFAPQNGKPQTKKNAQPEFVEPQPQQLPPGAQGLDPNGNPYFGEGISAILKKWQYNFTKDIKQVDDSEWKALKERWTSFNKKSKEIGSQVNPALQTEEQRALQQEGNKLLGENISKLWQAGSAQGSLLSPVLRGISASVTAIGELFSIPAQKLEQAIGAKEGFQEAANQVASPMPQLDDNEFTKFIEETPLGLAYDATRLALAPSDNKWDVAAKKIEEGWQSGRIFYSQIFDTTLKEKFMAEYRAGGDPALIAMKLQNPLAELGGQLIFDPLNLVGGFLTKAKTAKELTVAVDASKASGLLKLEEGAKALESFTKAENDASALKALGELTTAQKTAVTAVQDTSKLLNRGFGINDLTTSSRQNGLISKGKELMGNMALTLKQNGMDANGIAESILYGVKSVSANEHEMQIGLAGLANLPNANMWLADDYIETFTLMNRMMSNKNGIVDGTKLMELSKVKNPAEFATAASKLLRDAAISEFPDVDEMRKASALLQEANKTGGTLTDETRKLGEFYDSLPNHVKAANNIDREFTKWVRNPINKPLSMAYFNLQGGVAVRNIISNDLTILIDQGAKAWLRDGAYWSQESKVNFLNDVFGELPESAHGFKSMVGAATDSKPILFGKWMEKGEQQGAVTVVASTVRNTFEEMIPKALNEFFGAGVQKGTLTQKQVDKFISFARRHGNIEKALQEFRDFYKLGAVEEWRNLDFVTDFQRKGLQGMGYWDEIEDLARNGAASQANIEAVFSKMRKSIDSRSGMAVNDVVGLSPDHPGAPAWGDLMKAVEEGHLNPDDQQVFTAIMESAEQARLEYRDLLRDTALKSYDALSREGKFQEAQYIGQEMNRVQSVLDHAGPAAAKESYAITQDAWRWSDAIKAEKNPTRETLFGYWTKAGLEGEPPLDLSKKTLLSEIWKQRFEKTTSNWSASFDAVFQESETVLAQMGKVVDTNELQAMSTRARTLSAQTQALRTSTFKNKALRIIPSQDVAYVAKQYGIKPQEILNAINNKLPAGTQAFGKIEDVPTQQLMNVLEQVRVEKGLPELKGVAIPPPHPMGVAPSLPRAWNESSKGAKYALDSIKNEILARWGKTDDARKMTPEVETLLREVLDKGTSRMAEVKSAALKVAKEARDFTLLNYGEKTYADIAKSYILPYHFFYTRSTKNWISRLAQHPEIVAGYGKYKEALETINKDLPPWYKQQLNINPLADNPNFQGKSVLGIPLDHPLFINLEASINPLYGLTGTDFNDPAKRINWATATMDDMGKFGPTVWAPIQMAIAATLYKNGETDAASRWGSRLIPETAQIKAVSSLFGKPIELDPAVNFFSDGIDPYERGRMGYAASQLIASGQFTPEELQAQFQQGEGEGWDAAYQMAIKSRALSSFTSYIGGVGFKPRSENDVMVEDMMVKLNRLYASSDMMSGDQYKQAWEQLRSQYPDGLLDTVLLAKKGGAKRDAAYAYSVLGRLPPGELNEALASIGISNEEINKFYESKGFTDPNVKFTETEKQRFMAAIVDMGVMLKIPDSATRQEWNTAREVYGESLEEISTQLGVPYEKNEQGKIMGRGIWEMVSYYYDLKDDDKQAADEFKALHPEITQALQMKGAAIANSPVLSAYYGGIDNLEAYLGGQVRQQLTDKYGQEIYDVQRGYYDSPTPKAYLAQHPELKQFWADKRAFDAQSDKTFFEMAAKLPNGKPAQFQEGFAPQSPAQEQLANALQPQQDVPQWDEISYGMPDWLKQEVANYVATGTALTKRGQKEMDYLASQGGFYNAKDMLHVAALSLLQGQGQPVAGNQPQTSGGVNPFASP